MSFTTRCPACGTMFKVVPDQLKISDGWVRCGHCADVFDATLYLQTWEAPAPEPQLVPAAAPAAASESPQPSGTAPASVPSETANDLPTQALLAPAIEEAIPQATGVWDPSAAVIEDANEL
ncbi:zinc-ribbon domain-containing protein, partial [Hydrogenophaga sp.]|uniref:zinc-ribbon domain-containing protein n=1 Tax=Hydrogenophaga sp. TaxID=1904254 RepID=UPI00272FDA39